MDNLKVFDLFEQNRINKSTSEFMENVDSSLRIKTDYEKITKDVEWIDIIEEVIPYLDNILKNPNRFIINEEEIVKIELAKNITVDSIKHLAKHANLIQEIDEKNGDVKPSKILNINKEESFNTYEIRLIYTLIKNTKYFISMKKMAIQEEYEKEQKNDKLMEYKGSSKVSIEKIHINIQITTSLDNKDREINSENIEEILKRIDKLEEKIQYLTTLEVYKIIDKLHIALIKPPVKKTNLILKNVNFQYAMKLWIFLQDNIEDEYKDFNEKKDYMEQNQLKQLVDENFLLNYLAINILNDKDYMEKLDEESEEKLKLKEQLTDEMLKKIIEMNANLTEDQLKEIVCQKYQVIKYKNLASITDIQKIFKKHIDRYLEKITG